MAKSPIKNSYQKQASDLKRLGLISYPVTGELTRGQKSWVTRQANTYREVLKHPENFHIAKVSDKTAKQLKASKYTVGKTGKAIIPKKGFSKVTVKNGQLFFTGGNTAEGNNLKEVVTLFTADTFYGHLKKQMKKPLKPNQRLTLKIGDNAAFNQSYKTFEELFYYVNNKMQLDGNKKELMRIMSIVTVDIAPKKKPPKNAKNSKQNLTRK